MNLESLAGLTGDDAEREEKVMGTLSEIGVRELDQRSNDGIEVTLLWSPTTNRLLIAVADERSGESFTLDVDAADALDAFHHPYAYTGRASVDYAVAA
jgi:hypothetical protein